RRRLVHPRRPPAGAGRGGLNEGPGRTARSPWRYNPRASLPVWRNGRRGGLKIRCQRWRVGSSPITGTRQTRFGGFFFCSFLDADLRGRTRIRRLIRFSLSALRRVNPRQKPLYRRPEAGDVHQEGVMPLRRWQGQEFAVGAAGAQAVGDLFLLLQREEDVGFHADGQRALEAGLRQDRESV